jgi:hypothetical protein
MRLSLFALHVDTLKKPQKKQRTITKIASRNGEPRMSIQHIIFLLTATFLSGCASQNNEYAHNCSTKTPRNLCEASNYSKLECQKETDIINRCASYLNTEATMIIFKENPIKESQLKSKEQRKFEYEASLREKFLFGFGKPAAIYFDASTQGKHIASTEQAANVIDIEIQEIENQIQLYQDDLRKHQMIQPRQREDIISRVETLKAYQKKIDQALAAGQGYKLYPEKILTKKEKEDMYRETTLNIVSRLNPLDTYLTTAANNNIQKIKLNGIQPAVISTVGDRTFDAILDAHRDKFALPDGHDIFWAQNKLMQLQEAINVDYMNPVVRSEELLAKKNKANQQINNKTNDPHQHQPAQKIEVSGTHIKYQVPARKTKDTLREFGRYIVESDTDGLNQLIHLGECIFLYEGTTVSIISRGLMTATIRYKGFKLFTDTEALGD